MGLTRYRASRYFARLPTMMTEPYGSFASGTKRKGSAIDLVIISDDLSGERCRSPLCTPKP
jgi:predicted nucleotidyltransferase